MAQAQAGINQAIQSERKRLLIDATITAIASHGLSRLTLAKIASHAGMKAGTVNFHFDSKESLLLETLKFVAEEFERGISKAVEACEDNAGTKLCAIIDANLDQELSETRKVAVWYAFLAETRTRSDYQRICGDRDKAYYRKIRDLCRQIVAEAGRQDTVSADILAEGLAGMLDGFWSDILFQGDAFDRKGARQRCYGYLSNVFPWRFQEPGPVKKNRIESSPGNAHTALDETGLTYSLPAWVYHSKAFFEQEKERLFIPSWQLVCHLSDLGEVGSYVRYDMFNERAFVVRAENNKIHAFQNVCSHRAHTLVQDKQGGCPGRLTCPYHGWTYALDGRRIGTGVADALPEQDKTRFALKPLEVEVYLGFVFIRYRAEGPSVAECMAPLAEEFRVYRTEDMQAVTSSAGGDNGFWTEEVDVDWKNGLENYLEDHHFPAGHKELSALMNPGNDRQPLPNGVCRLSYVMREVPLSSWSVQRYRGLLPKHDHLSSDMQNRWTWYTLFPNTFFELFPEQMAFMQMIPLAPGKMLLRGRSYALPDSSRTGKAVRYLNDRINNRIHEEDNYRAREVQKGLATSGYTRGILSDQEVLVKHFQDWIRDRLALAHLFEEPRTDRLV